MPFWALLLTAATWGVLVSFAVPDTGTALAISFAGGVALAALSAAMRRTP